MPYYIIANDTATSFDLVHVLPADEANFLQDYGPMVQATGPDKLALLHSFAAQKAAQWLEPLPITPGLTQLQKRYPNHQPLRLMAYYCDHLGWIPCSPDHPQSGQRLTWIQQLKIAIMAGARSCRMAMAHKRSGRILYAECGTITTLR